MFQSYLGFTERIWHVGCEKLPKKPHQSTCLETHGWTLLTKNWLNKHVLGWKLIHDLNLLSWKGWKSWVSIIPNMWVVNHNFGSECSANANALNQETHRELNLMMEVLCIYSKKVSIKCCSKRLSWMHSLARALWQSGWQSWFFTLGLKPWSSQCSNRCFSFWALDQTAPLLKGTMLATAQVCGSLCHVEAAPDLQLCFKAMKEISKSLDNDNRWY